MMLLRILEERRLERVRRCRAETFKKVAVGAVLGLASGITAGLAGGILLAPRSGEKTREEIAKSAKGIGENIKIKTDEIKDTLEEKVEQTKGSVSEAKEKIANYLASKKASRSKASGQNTEIPDKEEVAEEAAEAEGFQDT